MNEQLLVQRLLHQKFGELRERNPSYSSRSFARKLALDSGALSSIMNGKRRVSKKLAERIAERLALDPQERSELLGSFPNRRLSLQRKWSDLEPGYLKLSAEQFRVFAEWQHFALLSLLRTDNFQNDVRWMAARLGLGVEATRQALKRLKELKLVEENEGRLQRTVQPLRSTEDIANTSIRRFHADGLELAKASLERDSVETRDFCATVMPIDSDLLPQAKELVRKFQDDLCALLENGRKRDAVYRIQTQLFPVTRTEDT